MYVILAEFTLIIHFVFIIFVIFGGLLFFIAKKIIFIHIPAFIWGAYMELTQSICPLTYLENWFLFKANVATYSTGFIQNYLIPFIYPTNLTKDIQINLGISLIILNAVIYGIILMRCNK